MSRLPTSGAARGVYVEGPRNDIYTALLLVALLFLVFGIIWLALEQVEYYGKIGPIVIDEKKAGDSGGRGGSADAGDGDASVRPVWIGSRLAKSRNIGSHWTAA